MKNQRSRHALKRLVLLISLLCSSPNSWAVDSFFKLSASEQEYFRIAPNEMIEMFASIGAIKKLAQDENLTLEEAEEKLREFARISAVCFVLGVRQYDEVYKNRVGELISLGLTPPEIKKELEEFLRQRIQNGDQSVDAPLKGLQKGIEFMDQCMSAAGEKPIPD